MSLTPQQRRRWQAKVESGGPGIVIKDDGKTRYYRMGGGNVARVVNQEYSYLEHDSGNWIPHPAVCDAVTGYKGDASSVQITEAEARALIRRFAGKRSGRTPGNP